jgi:2-iminobutanoate/2-iminopropanoate deaminase
MPRLAPARPGPNPPRPYSPSVRIGPIVAISGQCGYYPDRSLAAGLDAQVEVAFGNLRQALAAHGATLDDVLSVEVYLAREDHFERMNELYIPHFAEPRPARTTITAGLRPDVLFEISALAVLETSTQPGIPASAAQDPGDFG